MIISRPKSKFENSRAAWTDIKAKTGLQAQGFKTAHTSTEWRWEPARAGEKMAAIKCIAPSLMAGLKDFLKEEGLSKRDLEKLDELPSCTGEKLIEFSKGRLSGSKRAPSEYNLFVGRCMKEGKDLKQCAVEWKKVKKE